MDETINSYADIVSKGYTLNDKMIKREDKDEDEEEEDNHHVALKRGG